MPTKTAAKSKTKAAPVKKPAPKPAPRPVAAKAAPAKAPAKPTPMPAKGAKPPTGKPPVSNVEAMGLGSQRPLFGAVADEHEDAADAGQGADCVDESLVIHMPPRAKPQAPILPSTSPM